MMMSVNYKGRYHFDTRSCNPASARKKHRRLSGKLGIDIHSPANGVSLPKTGYGKMHTSEYYNNLKKLLLNIRSRERMILELGELRAQLLRDACSGG